MIRLLEQQRELVLDFFGALRWLFASKSRFMRALSPGLIFYCSLLLGLILSYVHSEALRQILVGILGLSQSSWLSFLVYLITALIGSFVLARLAMVLLSIWVIESLCLKFMQEKIAVQSEQVAPRYLQAILRELLFILVVVMAALTLTLAALFPPLTLLTSLGFAFLAAANECEGLWGLLPEHNTRMRLGFYRKNWARLTSQGLLMTTLLLIPFCGIIVPTLHALVAQAAINRELELGKRL